MVKGRVRLIIYLSVTPNNQIVFHLSSGSQVHNKLFFKHVMRLCDLRQILETNNEKFNQVVIKPVIVLFALMYTFKSYYNLDLLDLCLL